MLKGQIISGEFGRIIARQKSGQSIEIGELLIADSSDGKILMQVYDLIYGSQISQQNLEMISGMKLEENTEFELFDANLRSYMLAMMKSLVTIKDKNAFVSKALPSVFSEVKEINENDLSFLTKPRNPLFVGNLRSGSKVLDVPIYLDGEKVFSHHILIAGTTGRGKSVLVSNLLWNAIGRNYGILVLDPHDEYYGRNKIGLKDHPSSDRVVYYTPKNVPPGGRSLTFNLSLIKPQHFMGVMEWTTPQIEALNYFHKKYKELWIAQLVLDSNTEGFHEGTIAVVRRRLISLLDIDVGELGI